MRRRKRTRTRLMRIVNSSRDRWQQAPAAPKQRPNQPPPRKGPHASSEWRGSSEFARTIWHNGGSVSAMRKSSRDMWLEGLGGESRAKGVKRLSGHGRNADEPTQIHVHTSMLACSSACGCGAVQLHTGKLGVK
eukprot:6181717-Pleurochrysis_carterae.AAC.7